jgi:hypothetical protein
MTKIGSLGFLVLGSAAREMDASPGRLSDLFRRHRFPDEMTFVEGGRRFIHRDLLPQLKLLLAKKPGRPRKEPASVEAAPKPVEAA